MTTSPIHEDATAILDDYHETKKLPYVDDKKTPVDDILTASMNLFQSRGLMAFQLTGFHVTLCNQDKEEVRPCYDSAEPHGARDAYSAESPS